MITKAKPVLWPSIAPIRLNGSMIGVLPLIPALMGVKTIPFTLFKRQREFVQLLQECIAQKQSALIEKCRDIGASWICCAFSVWLWLFHPGSTVGWGSRKEEYVDEKGNPKAIFPKMRQIIDHLPSWMLRLDSACANMRHT
jgi:hypothetical protein